MNFGEVTSLICEVIFKLLYHFVKWPDATLDVKGGYTFHTILPHCNALFNLI